MLKRTLFKKILNYCDDIPPKLALGDTIKIYYDCYCYGCMSGSLCKYGHGLHYAN